MKKMIKKLEKYRDENFPESKEELAKVNQINNELSIVINHSDDKITFSKSMLTEYIDLACKYKIIEGITMAIQMLKDSNTEE